MSSRYAAIVSLLEDPVNQACVLREFLRKRLGDSKILPPPVRWQEEGGNRGWLFPTLREAMRMDLSTSIVLKKGANIDSVYEVYTDGQGWYIHCSYDDDDLEIGPFDNETRALQEAHSLIKEAGFVLLDRDPWISEDLQSWSL